MKLLFFGTSDFAVPALKKIMISKHELAAVVTQPDRKRGRRLLMGAPPVKIALKGSVIPLHQPEDLSRPDMIRVLKGYGADLFIVVAFGRILKSDILEMPKTFSVNLHASLLPKYRGASPINRAVINGDEETGLTTIRMDEGMDTGDIILKEKIKIFKNDTSQALSERLSNIGAALLIKTIDMIESGKTDFKKQDNKKVSYAYKLKKEDGHIDWSLKARDIHNMVRGLIPWPGAYTHWQGKILKIWESSLNEDMLEEQAAGSVLRIDDKGITVGTGRGEIIIEALQLEGAKRLGPGEFLRGHRLKVGEKFL